MHLGASGLLRDTRCRNQKYFWFRQRVSSLCKCTDACVHRAPRCIPAAWHRIAPCPTVHHHLCAPAPWCIPAAWHRGAPCTTVRDRPCAPALRCISASWHHGARCSTMCDPGAVDEPRSSWHAVRRKACRRFAPSPTVRYHLGPDYRVNGPRSIRDGAAALCCTHRRHSAYI